MKLWALQERIAARAGRVLRRSLDQMRALSTPTYAATAGAQSQNERFGFLDHDFMVRLAALSPWHPGVISRLADDAIGHRFDLLGSGPVVVAHGIKCAGLAGISFDPVMAPDVDADGRWLDKLVNRSNVAESRRIWRCIEGGYTPIDWQLDFKSGYRWSEKTWYGRIRFGHLRGVDVKVPWELARMQHLPALALAAHYARAGLLAERTSYDYVREAKNQMLDFIATNPPGFGVNWACAMDVGIRVANMVVTFDMMAATGVDLGEDFQSIFSNSVLAHGRHIARNMEWSPIFRGNHYLANIAGLLFAAVHLSRSRETEIWLSFGTAELITELEYQFHPDGSTFEASVCYHRLSSEIVLWSFALLDNLPVEKHASFAQAIDWSEPTPPRRKSGPLALHTVPGTSRLGPIPPWCRERLHKMAGFTKALTRPDGLIVQFGDNDSGRFLNFGASEVHAARGNPGHPAWSLDHRSVVSGIDAFLGYGCEDAASAIIAAFAGRGSLANTRPTAAKCPDASVGNIDIWNELLALSDTVEQVSAWRTDFCSRPGILDKLERQKFNGMGCFVFRSPTLYLAIRCGEIGIHGLGAHAHCDQLAIELLMDGKSLARDPGSYIYTPLPEVRNRYRSVMVHHAPRHLHHEPADLLLGVFDLRESAVGECLFFGDEGFVGRHRGYGFDVYRIVRVCNDRVSIVDFSPDGHHISDPQPDKIDFSSGYGFADGTGPR
ncbi:heparinase II/III family protein [Devosia algicola]|uniref:Heparinase II/III family protein n=1 Tax=Devosia algicola TaxID=3026418 RepID=A0ABY7YMN8_9HYPH|nr:heparinase II/III family protein [Devosia algicola]WDR02350.1 heparinase II/III family protein [Devosia algicola]